MKVQCGIGRIVLVVLSCGGNWALAADRPADADQVTVESFENDELKQLIAESKAERADFIEARRTLRQQLADAMTLEERRALLRQFWEDHRDMILTQRAMRRHFHHLRMKIRRERRERIRN